MQVLVTGGGGFLGAALCEALLARGDTVVSLDARPGGNGVVSEIADVADRAAVEAVFARHRPEAVIHCAAIVIGTAPGGEATAAIMRVNIEGTVNVYDAALRHGAGRVLHISSEEVYGDFTADRITEDHPLSSDAPYSISKAAVEQLGRHYSRNAGLDVVNIRTSWVYGPGLPRPRIPKTLVEAAVQGRSLHLANGGEHLIDHTYVDDFVAGTLLLLDAGALRHDCYHVGSGTAVTVAEIVDIIRELVPGADLTVGPGPLTSAHGQSLVRKGALDVTRIGEELGYVARFPPREGLAAYIRHLRAAP